ncbi:MAG: PqqD family protein [Clostridia bacterium]|nr:PqqD family protein [Clostridia bacterium]
MKLNKNFILHVAEGETLLVPTGDAEFSGIIRGNATLGAVLELLREEITEEKLVASMKAKFDAPLETIGADVERALAVLRKVGALDE